jgi:hypothetical protein
MPCFPLGGSQECTNGDPDAPDWMAATYYGTMTIQNHLISLGQAITATATPDNGGGWVWGQIPGKIVWGCTGESSTCTFIPAAASPYPPSEYNTGWEGGWQVFNISFCGFFGCAPSGDYYYVSGDPVISGYVTDAAGNPAQNPTISISGSQVTNYDPSTGFYSAIVNAGANSVTATNGSQADTVALCTGQGTNATQDLVITVQSLPAFTGATSASAVNGQNFSATIHASGSPTPTLSVTGLPSWLRATDGSSGTLTLTGRPRTATTVELTVTATNSVGSVSEQYTVNVS